MGHRTPIEWTDWTWNPTRGCRRKSEGCRHCYAERVAGRFSKEGEPYHGLAEIRNGESQWTGKGLVVEHAIDEPLRMRKPRMIFVNSMSDLFYEAFDTDTIARIVAVMALAHWHKYQVLTKRDDRMLALLTSAAFHDRVTTWIERIAEERGDAGDLIPLIPWRFPWPLPWVWWGVSIENQDAANERLPRLAKTPAAVRMVSFEPLLGPVDASRWLPIRRSSGGAWLRIGDERGFDWAIIGGESGPGARRMETGWARELLQQCRAAGVPVFVKQLGAHPIASDALVQLRISDKKGGRMSEWPEDLRVREWPTDSAA